MTVPSMPMRSEFARFIPAMAPVAPRQMLPPPTTTASSNPPRSIALDDLASEEVDRRRIDRLVARGRGEGLTRQLQDDASHGYDLSPDDHLGEGRDRRAPRNWAMVCFSSCT